MSASLALSVVSVLFDGARPPGARHRGLHHRLHPGVGQAEGSLPGHP